MRRLGVLAALVLSLPFGGSDRPLPLRSPQAATTPLTGFVSAPGGSSLAQVDPATLSVVRRSASLGYWDSWVRSPDGRLLAVATHPASTSDSTLRFANPSTLRFARRGVRLGGVLRAALWPHMGTLLALVDCSCGPSLTLQTVDTVAKREVAERTIEGPIASMARSRDGLVLLAEASNTIGPARLVTIDSDGSVRSARLDQILAGVHFDQSSQDPIGTIREPGLAVDPAAGIAYVVDPDGLVAEVELADLSVAYHRLSSGSFLDRLSAWLAPPASAKGVNGPSRTALWLGDGLIAVAGSDESATRQKDGSATFDSQPAGLSVIDTRDWSVRTIDPAADTATVADGVLLASGASWRSGTSGPTGGEGLAAYGPDGSLLWRMDPGGDASVATVYGSRAIVQRANGHALEVVDVDTGKTVRTVTGGSSPWLLLGSGG